MATVCHWHPDRETGLRCGQCGKPMCTECMRQHPVGIRCKECARQARLPTYQISTSYVVRGVAAAIGMGLLGGIALGIIGALFPFAGFLFFALLAGVGYVIGEGVSAVVNRRRGRPYQYMAAAGVLIATGPSLGIAVVFGGINIGTLFALGGIAIAVYVAMGRLRP